MPLTAVLLEQQYGTELSQGAYKECLTSYSLHKALEQNGILVTRDVCRKWWHKYRKSEVEGASSASTDGFLSAKELHEQYGHELTEGVLAQCPSAYFLHQALYSKGLKVSQESCKQWWQKYRDAAAVAASGIKNAQELQELHGPCVKFLASEYKTPFLLCKALRERDPPVYALDSIVKTWLKKYGGHENLTSIQTAGHLEDQYGEQIRAKMPEGISDGPSLKQWLHEHLKVSADKRTCEKWITTVWRGSGAFLYY